MSMRLSDRVDGPELFAVVVFTVVVCVVAGMALKAGWELMAWLMT